ncbi:MAG: DUF2461 domain-containing protein [Phaeodactylibacter sp.]|uniref:DUF2461 domain-containing protein n=1 Tax=Phaeodactylibacter sp. TaxID=1940289 RepID=UPI0032ECF21D
MNFRKLYDFLRDLQQNNDKSWMDANRDYYHALRDEFIDYLDALNARIAKVDPNFLPKPGREAINRINNNLLFHPNAPTYKDHFAAGLDANQNTAALYFHIGLDANIAAGGFYKPGSDFLKRIRAAIDYDGEELRAIINSKPFQKTFGGLMEVEMLKTSPKGYTQDHRHIDLLRHKSFVVSHTFTQAEVQRADFTERVVEVFETMAPFRAYLNRAVSVEA